MEAIFERIGGMGIGLLAALMLGGMAYSQNAVDVTGDISAQTASTTGSSDVVSGTTTDVSGNSSPLSQFENLQQALAQQLSALESSGATWQQVDEWRQQNAAQYAQRDQLGMLVSMGNYSQPIPLVSGTNIPAGLSSTLQDFVAAQVASANARAQLHNQFVSELPAGASAAQIEQIRQQEEQALMVPRSADSGLQQQRVSAITAEQAAQPVPIPGPPVFPLGSSPGLKAFITARNALAQSWAEFENQYRTADPATRQAATQQWQQQNANLVQAMRAAGQQLVGSNSNQAEVNQ